MSVVRAMDLHLHQLFKRFHNLHTAHVLSRTFPKREVADEALV
jgi:hypothetical protein